MKNTKIEWADHTFSPWWGCTKVSPACDHCYAAEIATRFKVVQWGADQPRKRTTEKTWAQALKWNASHDAFFRLHGRRQRVFCASMADVFDNEVDPKWRADLFDLIAATPNLDWLLLTKRIGNVKAMIEELADPSDPFSFTYEWLIGDVPDNVWLGATICNQMEADRDIPKLLNTPAAKRFLSIEPLLNAIDLTPWTHTDKCLNSRPYFSPCICDESSPRSKLDWVIVGGEAGRSARPMHPDWVRRLRDQCADADVEFFFKQWGTFVSAAHHADENLLTENCTSGGWLEIDGDLSLGETAKPHRDGAVHVFKANKKHTGRLLDGQEHNGVPT